MSGTIQPAVLSHAAAMAAIHAAAFPAEEAWGEDAIALQLGLSNVFGLIDARGGMLLGRVTMDDAEVLTLAVDPAARRRGIASALLRAAQAEMRVRGCLRVFLEVAIGNAAARALYRREGFFEVGRRRRYYADRSDAIVLRVDIL
jgi:[ribosomal protein S18]-alanine N-acetyltransferase